MKGFPQITQKETQMAQGDRKYRLITDDDLQAFLKAGGTELEAKVESWLATERTRQKWIDVAETRTPFMEAVLRGAKGGAPTESTESTEGRGRVRTKIVYISKCMDCPVDVCENRQVCGGIPEECELDDATPIKVSYRCRGCGRQFVLTNAQHAYCPYCGAGDLQLY